MAPCPALHALNPANSIFQYNCRSWSSADGLKAGRINCIAQRQDGYLWMATQNGLIRFDGKEFKSFPIATEGNKERAVDSVSIAADGGLWLSLSTGGFGSFDGTRFTLTNEIPGGAQSSPSNAVMVASDGSVWTGSMDGVEHLVNGKSAGFVSLGKRAPVSSLGENPKGRVWIGTMGNGLWYQEAGAFKEFPDPDLRATNVLGTITDAGGDIWVGTSNGLYHYDSTFRRREILLRSSRVTALLVDRHGLLWAGTDALGLGRYANGKLAMLRKGDGLGSDAVTSIFEDAEGSVWAGTSGGLSQLSDVRFPIFSSKEGFLPGPAFAVAAAPNRGLWVATLYGSTYFDGRTPFNYPDPHPGENNPRRLIAATDGYVYFGDRAKNIRVYSPQGAETIYPATSWVEAFTEDKQGVIVGLGPRLMRVSGGQLQPYHFRDEETVLDWIYSLCASRDGAIWVGTNHGIFRIKDGDYREWTTPEGLLTNQVDSVTEDAEGNIWACTTWGILRIKSGRLTLVGEANGLSDDRIYGIVPDNQGQVWINSGRGLQRVSRQSVDDFAEGKITRVECQTFEGTESVKFVDRDNQAFQGCKTNDGRIWFPSPHGVIMVDPKTFFQNRVPPRVSIGKVTMGGRDFTNPTSTKGQVIDTGITISFSAIGLIAADKIRVRYRMEHFDEGWIDAGNERTVTYNRLKPGSYSFRVQAANEDGVWNTAGDTVEIELTPPFYRSLWFYGLLALLVSFGIYRFYGWKARSLRERENELQVQNSQLESKVSLRTDELNRSLALLRSSEQKFKAMFEQAAVGVAQIDVNTGRFIQINQHFCDIMGRTREEMELFAISELVAPKELGLHLEKMAQLRSGESRESTREGQFLRKDGSAIWVSMTISAMWRIGEQADYVIAVAQDVSGRKRLEDQIRQSQKMDAIGTLAGGVAHDFNNILSIINGYVQLAEIDMRDNPRISEHLRAVRVATDRATDLVRQILTFSRQQPFERRPTALVPIVAETLKLLRASIPSTVEFKTEFATNVPMVLADATQIHQIVMNLGTNAWQAMKDQTGRLEVKLGRCVVDAAFAAMQPKLRPGVYARLSVSDTGSGMDPATLGRIFEPFFTTKPVGEGTGLGLAVVHGIMDNHDGAITAYSALGEGTIFQLYFPEYVGAPAKVAVDEKKVPRGQGQRIMLVDDEELLTTLGKLALTNLGYEVETAARPEAAIEMFRTFPGGFALVLTDQTMPGMTGLVLARHLKEIQPGLPVILMTGNNISVSPAKLRGAGITQVLLKPHSLHALATAVQLGLNSGPTIPLDSSALES
jgi:PAS domain S-box-containing protein